MKSGIDIHVEGDTRIAGIALFSDLKMDIKSGQWTALLGPSGAGKSTIGSILAKKIDYEFIDIDDKIEKFQRMEIAKIFKIKGEENFRNIEEKISIKYLRDNGKVIALGGGAFLNKNIQSLIAKNHVSFWLN